MAIDKNKIFEKINAVVEDITTLEVTTFSGTIDINNITVGADDNKKINFQKILSQLGGDGADSSKIKLIASTKIDLDSDTIQFVKEDLSDSERELVKLHRETLSSSQQARQAAMEFLIGLLGIKTAD